LWKIANVLVPHVFNTPLKEFLEFCNGCGIQKVRVMPLPGGVKSWMIYAFVLITTV